MDRGTGAREARVQQHLREGGVPAEAAEPSETPGVDGVVGGLEQAAVAPAIAVGPEDRLVRPETLAPDPRRDPRVLLGAATVLALVAASEQAAACLEAGRDCSMRPEQFRSGAHVELGRRGNDHHEVAALLVPLEPFAGVMTQAAPEVTLGELGAGTFGVGHRDAGEGAHEQRFFGVVRGRAADEATAHDPREIAKDGERDRTVPAQRDEELKDAATIGQRAVEVEGRDGWRMGRAHVDVAMPVWRASGAPERPSPAENRCAPAALSPLAITSRPSRASLAAAASSSSPHCSIAESRSLRRHDCGKSASPDARHTADSSAVPGGTTRLTRPIARASSAPTARPVRMRSIARECPISRGSRTVPRSTSGTPNLRQKTPKTASAEATRRSHHNASSSPPATA